MADGDAEQNQGGGWLSGAWSLGQSVYNAAASAVNRWDAGEQGRVAAPFQFKLASTGTAAVGSVQATLRSNVLAINCVAA